MSLLDAPDLISHTLGNGLRVVLCQDGRLPIAAICVWYEVGAHDEPPGRTGLAHLFEHMMFQGSAHVGANDHTAYVQGIGGATNGDTTHEGTYFLDEILSNHLRPVLWLEAERMSTVGDTLTEDRLENQRRVVINERMQRYDNRPLALVWERLLRLATPEGHPYQHMPAGQLTDLYAITLDDARRFWHRYYTPDNAVLTVVGQLEPDSTMAWIERYFGPIPPGRAPVSRPRPPAATMPEAIFEHAAVDIGHVGAMSVYRLPATGASDNGAAELAVSVLGAARYGRLRRALLPTALAADVGFTTIPLAHAPSLAILNVVPAGHGTLPTAQAVIHETLCRFADDGPTEEELAIATGRHEHSVLERLATVEGRAVELAKGAALYDNPHHVYMAAAELTSLRPRQVRDAAARYLTKVDRAVLTYGEEPGS